MDAQQEARLRSLLMHVYPTDWHAGRTTGRALYHGDGPDDMIGVMDTRHLAELVVLSRQYAREQLLKDGG